MPSRNKVDFGVFWLLFRLLKAKTFIFFCKFYINIVLKRIHWQQITAGAKLKNIFLTFRWRSAATTLCSKSSTHFRTLRSVSIVFSCTCQGFCNSSMRTSLSSTFKSNNGSSQKEHKKSYWITQSNSVNEQNDYVEWKLIFTLNWLSLNILSILTIYRFGAHLS